ncbi:MAG: hypothetical protein GQ540_06055 [Lutibacter sp.]|uniref:hypothetical protein n=1 Tax=Lutibacter sp. TaxID=1925666 RepID=UPI0019F3B296|nr:hypothetical protein [Lutibacter sp.]NOR28074.1 hypothetical protein [Lutibacter sp.]
MKTKITYLPLFLILCYTSVFSQEKVFKTIIKPLQEDILYREKVFLHVNKSSYFTNETIWVTAYVAEDAENKPSIYTSNLHINLVDIEGNVIQQKTIFIQNGVGNGDFLLDDNLESGKYFVQGFTNYMRNFGKENMFIQEIEIINSELKKEIKQQQYSNNYDIQLFPESGYLLENVKNTLSIKALINGKGFPFSGEITNSKGLKITDFEGNMLGMGKCKFTYSENETYTAVIKINNTIQKLELPKANKTGIIFSLDNTHENHIVLTLKTNIQTLPTLQKSNISLLFYRNNYISQAASLSLINSEETTQKIVFDKGKFLNGVNIVTLFKDKQPIAERKFFVDKPNEQTAILINKLKTKNDSTSFKIKTINSNFNPEISQLSVSVLPKNAKNFYENQTIKSAFLLSPYVKGTIENPAYYFENNNPNKKGFLDLLLLNQGWSTYSLEEKIKEINPKERFKFESGFTVKGNLKKIKKGYDIGMLSKENRLVDFSKLNEHKEFNFKNVYAYKGGNVKISLIKKGEPIVKPTNINFNKDKPETKNYKSLIHNYIKPDYVVGNNLIETSESLTVSNYKLYPSIEVLDQITLKTVVSKKEKTFYDKENELAHKHKVLAPSFYQNKKVTERMETTFQTIFEYFTSLGYIKRTYTGRYFISLRNARVTFVGKNMNPDNTYPPKIFLDGISLNRDGDIEMLKELSMTDIDEILINKSGAGGGIDGTGGIIKIYRKKGNHQYFEEEGKNLYEELILLTGFDRANDYYKPQYNIYTEDAYNWSEIDWKNNLQTDEKGEVFIKIPINEFSNEYQFIINGFSGNGLLFNTNYKTSLIGF